MNRLSIIVPYIYDYTDPEEIREQSLIKLLYAIRNQTFGGHELILVEYIVKGNRAKFKHRNLVNKYISLTDPRPFNKSWCINVAMKESYHNSILVIDADNLFGLDYFERIKKHDETERKNNIFLCYNHYIKMPGRDEELKIYTNERYTISGVWYVSKDFFFSELGGMNENYFGYGAEDDDLTCRVEYRYLDNPPYMNYSLIHQYHHLAQPAPDRIKKLEITKADVGKTMKILINNKELLGNKDSPTILEFEK